MVLRTSSCPARVREKMDAEACCRLCGASDRLTRHHLVPQWWFSEQHRAGRVLRGLHKHHPDNIVPLCSYCHEQIEGQRGLDRFTRQLRRRVARQRLRGRLTAGEIAFVVKARGEAWLEHHYPSTVSHHDAQLAFSARG